MLYIGKKKDTQGYYVKNKDSDYIYVVDNESITKLMKKKKILLLLLPKLYLKYQWGLQNYNWRNAVGR